MADRATQLLARRLALKGQRREGSFAPHVTGEWVPYCDAPVTVWRYVRPGNGRRGLEVSFPAPCRKCDKCMRFKRMRWRQRMINELIMSDDAGARSWLVTLTFSPVHMAGVLAEAKALQHRGKLPTESIELAAYGHVQKYFKRLRKQGAVFRYCGVPEYGTEHGRLHFHVLLHETARPVLKAQLQSNWRSFVHAKLVDCSTARGIGGAASYTSKYMTKDGGRPRASLCYGVPPSAPCN